jgi:hypothetical protein
MNKEHDDGKAASRIEQILHTFVFFLLLTEASF